MSHVRNATIGNKPQLRNPLQILQFLVDDRLVELASLGIQIVFEGGEIAADLEPCALEDVVCQGEEFFAAVLVVSPSDKKVSVEGGGSEDEEFRADLDYAGEMQLALFKGGSVADHGMEEGACQPPAGVLEVLEGRTEIRMEFLGDTNM